MLDFAFDILERIAQAIKVQIAYVWPVVDEPLGQLLKALRSKLLIEVIVENVV